MNYYEHHLGDYMRDTAHLSLLEDGAYRRLLDAYYVRERPLPVDLRDCCKLARAVSKAERDAVAYVLREFFVLTDDGHRQQRADAEIERFRTKSDKARASVKARWDRTRVEGGTNNERNTNVSADGYERNTDGIHRAPVPRHQTPIEATSIEVASPRPPSEGPQLALVEGKSEKASLPDCPHLDLLQAWAEELPTMPQHRPELWRGARADHLRARWREQAVQRKWQTSADGVAWFRRLFGYIGQSEFLTGRTASQNGRPPFQIELEWLAMPTNFAKVMEGKYHREAAA